MKASGIKVWVLTGDKIETAMNIGVSAGLLDTTMLQHIVEDTDKTALKHTLESIKFRVNDPVNYLQKQAIIVAGASLVIIDSSQELRELFLGASDRVDVVLACRVSPKQKADIVNMIRSRFPNKGTLSIGDGANDVNMILQAHVGVGILGKEGQQAARSADFAIGQFKFLKPLMFVHGREAYRRNSMLILYNFYKNVMYVTAQYFFGFYSAFSGQPLYEPMIYQLYNITMTSVPIMFYSLFDFEYEKDVDTGYGGGRQHYFMKHPHLYKIGLNSECFGIGHYLKWVLYGLFHAFLIYLFNF